jgi:protoheme IX farnesyltransferase
MSSAVIEGALSPTLKAAGASQWVKNTLRSYVQLTKPRIVLLFTLTGIAGLMVEGSLRQDLLRFWMVVLGTLLTAGSANAFNQYIDRDIDAIMERTRKKRPLPQGLITPPHALGYAIVTGIIATALLWVYGTPAAAFWGVFTIAFYVGVYTLWLKRSTPQNIVIGGAAGATAPLIGWAAGTGQYMALIPFILFLIIFVWTPPHFWALALCIKDEYAGVDVPMLPVVAGEASTRRQIFAYSAVLVPLTLAPWFLGAQSIWYGAAATALGIEFLRRAWIVRQGTAIPECWKLFGYSIVYLLVLYTVMIGDKL